MMSTGIYWLIHQGPPLIFTCPFCSVRLLNVLPMMSNVSLQQQRHELTVALMDSALRDPTGGRK